MRRTTDNTNRPIDFFVSYSPADERWATWIAWELEAAGYSTMLQAWDFVPGTNFIDFMDRGVSEAAAVISVLSRNYLASRYGRLEWQAALRSDPDGINRLVTVRVEDCPLEGLLSMITYLDLVGVSDPKAARAQLLARIREALGGRAKPHTQPGYPSPRGPDGTPAPWPVSDNQLDDEPGVPPASDAVARLSRRRIPVAAPAYPPVAPDGENARSSVTVLHLPGPRFGRGLARDGAPKTADELQAQIYGELTRLAGDGAPEPDLLVVTGDLTENGSRREFAVATEFLTGLRVLLGLEPNRLVVVPGGHDITRSACQAYFASCEADDVVPKLPYWPKWRHFTRLFEELYQGLDELAFDSQQPWTLFAVPDLRVVVAGLNSTINDSHREDDHYGWIGETQAAWFAQRLRPFEQQQWLRIGALRHAPAAEVAPVPGSHPDPARLHDTATLNGLLGNRLNVLLHGGGPGPDATEIGALDGTLPLVPPAGPDRCQLLQLTAEGLVRIPCRPLSQSGRSGSGARTVYTRQWRGAGATFAAPPTELTGPGQTGPGQAGPEPVGARPEDGPDPAEEAPLDPTRLLLERITEVLQTRSDSPKIRLV
ncbi:MAG: TIR domain-containing protein, partial [Pseudonocardiaceae bacterium]